MSINDGPPAIESALVDQYFKRRASEERYRTLINNMPAGVLQVDASHMGAIFGDLKKSGVTDIEAYLAEHPELVDFANETVMIKEVNDIAVSMMGATDASQLLGPVAFLFRETPGMAENVMSSRFRGKTNFSHQLRMKTFDGRTLDVLLMVSYPQQATTFDRTILVIVDVTERVRIERDLRRMEEQFAQFARLSILAELSGSIVHEVKQPLSAVLADVATTLRWLDRDQPDLPKVRQLLERIRESVHRTDEVVQRVNDLSRQSRPNMHAADINQIVADALAFVAREAERKSVRLSAKLSDRLPLAQMDPIQVQQLLVNLMINAIQAASQVSAKSKNVAIKTGLDDKHLVVEVQDDGPGIPESIADDLFDSFVTTKENGMGMGLSICRAIARTHAGEVVARNASSGGAIFEVRLPLERN